MHSTKFAASLLSAATLISSTLASPVLDIHTLANRAGASGSSQPSLAVYWGNGNNQQRLAEFCQDTTMDIIPIGFVNVFPDQAGANGYPGTNYANACGGDLWVAPDGTQTQMFKNCYQIEEDIPVCQALGKKILASIGGASPGNFIASTTSAKDFADFLWGSFGPAQDNSYYLYPRPFGINVTVDGFDLDIESGGDFGYADLANELRAKFEGQPKQYYISSAPQCATNDTLLGDAIANAAFDYVFVQYYNDDQCSARSLFGSGSLNTTADPSWGWADWLQNHSKNKDVKLFVGLPASTDAAQSNDYLNLDEAQALIEAFACGSTCKSTFGGVMLWEATSSANNQINGLSYAANIKNILAGLPCAPGHTTTATTITTTTSPLTTTTTGAVTTTTTTIPWSSSAGPIDGYTTSSASGSPVVTTTTSWSSPVGPVGGHTTSPTNSRTTSETTAASSSSYSHSVGPIGGTISSGTTTKTTTTTTTTSKTTTTEVTTTNMYSSSHSVGPIGSTTSTWTTTIATTTTTTTSLKVGPGHTSSSSLSTTPVTYSTSGVGSWGDWTISVTAPYVVDPKSTTTTTVASWQDWSLSAAVEADVTTTALITSYIDVCPTGFTTQPFTLTTTVPVATGAATPFAWPTAPNGCPQGFTTTVTVCSVCAETVTTVTLTIPLPTTPAVQIQTLVPVKPSALADHPVPTSTLTTAINPATTSVAPASTSHASGSGYPASAQHSSSPVSPINMTPFTGGTSRDRLPCTVLSVSICIVVAIAGLLL